MDGKPFDHLVLDKARNLIGNRVDRVFGFGRLKSRKSLRIRGESRRTDPIPTFPS